MSIAIFCAKHAYAVADEDFLSYMIRIQNIVQPITRKYHS